MTTLRDPLAAIRGILYGVIVGASMWLLIFAVAAVAL